MTRGGKPTAGHCIGYLGVTYGRLSIFDWTDAANFTSEVVRRAALKECSGGLGDDTGRVFKTAGDIVRGSNETRARRISAETRMQGAAQGGSSIATLSIDNLLCRSDQPSWSIGSAPQLRAVLRKAVRAPRVGARQGQTQFWVWGAHVRRI